MCVSYQYEMCLFNENVCHFMLKCYKTNMKEDVKVIKLYLIGIKLAKRTIRDDTVLAMGEPSSSILNNYSFSIPQRIRW